MAINFRKDYLLFLGISQVEKTTIVMLIYHFLPFSFSDFSISLSSKIMILLWRPYHRIVWFSFSKNMVKICMVLQNLQKILHYLKLFISIVYEINYDQKIQVYKKNIINKWTQYYEKIYCDNTIRIFFFYCPNICADLKLLFARSNLRPNLRKSQYFFFFFFLFRQPRKSRY